MWCLSTRRDEDLGADIATGGIQLKLRPGDPASGTPAAWSIAEKLQQKMKIGFDSRIIVG